MDQLIKVFTALALAFVIMAAALFVARKLAAWLDAKRRKSDSAIDQIETNAKEKTNNSKPT